MSIPNREPAPFNVPKEIGNGGPIFAMSATHRGDMYHLRAALQLPTSNYSLVLYDSNHTDNTKPKTGDLEDYLSATVLKNKKHVFIVPWTSDQLSSRNAPTSVANCFLDGNSYKGAISSHRLVKFGEFDATLFVSQASDPVPPRLGRLPDEIRNGMAFVDEKFAKTLPAKFKKLLEEDWGIYPNQSAILAMYRDTGTKGLGVYPELDSGTALKEIGDILENLPNGKQLKIVSCGLKGAPKGAGIGEYWVDLKKLRADHVKARDFEAYFLKWAYDNGYYKMATGFRSGPLDLFTFMGIPTVSIGLRQLVGEVRHALLAKEWFKRVNIQYDQPRHNTTAYIKHLKHKPNKPFPPVIGSPFWGGEKPSQPPDDAVKRRKAVSVGDRKTQQAKPPGPFAKFDARVVEIGYRVACQRYMNWPELVKMQNGLIPHVIDTHVARSCWPAEKSKTQYFQESKALDEGDIQVMKDKLEDVTHTLQESQVVFGEYQMVSLVDWTTTYSLLGDEEVYDCY